MKRVFWIVLDSAGIGAAEDSADFGDAGCNTWKSCFDSGRLRIPNMERIGIYQIDGMDYAGSQGVPQGSIVRLEEKSKGKDTTTGHWEMAGIVTEKPFPVFPNGFPEVFMQEFSKRTGRALLCNCPYSGSEVIRDYGQEHEKTGALIVYTSADSVFQIAAHEDVIPVDTLYEYCKIAREMLQGDLGVGRVIARPFIGTWPDYERTVRRHDFSLEPTKETVLDALAKEGKEVIGVGKIYDIFAGRGITTTYPNQGNEKNMERVLEIQKTEFEGLCYVNLVDFDMVYGHRRNIEGYTDALNRFDAQLGTFLEQMQEDDMLMITADHGCDPGFSGTDHTREYVPCLCYGSRIRSGVNLHTRQGFADMAATVAQALGSKYTGDGKGFFSEISK